MRSCLTPMSLRDFMRGRSLTEQIDTTTPAGTLTFHIFGAMAEFERSIIRERTRAGLDAARARGRNGGPHVPSPRRILRRPGRCWPIRPLVEQRAMCLGSIELIACHRR